MSLKGLRFKEPVEIRCCSCGKTFKTIWKNQIRCYNCKHGLKPKFCLYCHKKLEGKNRLFCDDDCSVRYRILSPEEREALSHE